jgi:enoyl-CoA hydratase/carnithine racemase
MNLEALSQQSEEDAIKTLYLTDILLYKVIRSSKFTISAINGHAVGSGAVLALATDYRIINNNDKIKVGFPEYPKGLTLPGLMREIVQRAGLNNARMLLMGDLVTPQRAEQLGLVDELCECDVLKRLEELCALFSSGSFNYKQYKQHFIRQEGFSQPQAEDPEYQSVVAMVYSLAHKEQ